MSSKKFLAGTALVAGTSIGAAALALPIVSSGLGVMGTFFSFLLCWYVMYLAGLMVLEVSMETGSEKSFISMAEYTLGKGYKWPIVILYLILLYSLLAAYFRGGADLIHGLFSFMSILNIPDVVESIPFIIVTFFVVYSGTNFVDRLNRVMVFGLVLSFLVLVISCLSVMNFKHNIQHFSGDFDLSLKLLPVIITAFGYQVVIPSIRHYLADTPQILPKVIFFGSIIPFFLYFVWTLLIYMSLPSFGEFGIDKLRLSMQPAIDLPLFLENIYHYSIITYSINAFAFFALSSSLLGIAISLFDFLADKLVYSSLNIDRYKVVILTILPPSIFAFLYPQGFMLALSFAGVFVAILNGILPVLMCYKLRKKIGKEILIKDFLAMFLVSLVSIFLLISALL